MDEQLRRQYDRLRGAALALYFAGDWKAEDVPGAGDLWKELRNALDIPAGTSTIIMQARRKRWIG